MKIARTIITLACPRNCSYCCNGYKTIMDKAKHITNLREIKDFDMVCVTGGEPMLNPERTLAIIHQLREQNPGVVIYLYTAKYVPELEAIIPHVQGIHFTLHADSTVVDIEGFNKFQALISQHQHEKSYRLYVSPTVDYVVPIYPQVWTRVEVKPWIVESELHLPEGETLFVLESE